MYLSNLLNLLVKIQIQCRSPELRVYKLIQIVNKINASLSDNKLVFVQSWLHIRISIAIYPLH